MKHNILNLSTSRIIKSRIVKVLPNCNFYKNSCSKIQEYTSLITIYHEYYLIYLCIRILLLSDNLF